MATYLELGKVVERLPLRFAVAGGKAVTMTFHLLENLGRRETNQRKTIEKQTLETIKFKKRKTDWRRPTKTHRVAAFEHILIGVVVGRFYRLERSLRKCTNTTLQHMAKQPLNAH